MELLNVRREADVSWLVAVNAQQADFRTYECVGEFRNRPGPLGRKCREVTVNQLWIAFSQGQQVQTRVIGHVDIGSSDQHVGR